MQLKIYLILNQYVIFNSLFENAIANPIIGEKVRKAIDGEFPAIVSLMYSSGRVEDAESDHFCSGTLFTKCHVITAAHCIEDTEKNETQVVVGSISLRTGIVYSILWWVDYNRWTEVKGIHLEFRVNDIAILKLTQNVPDNILPYNLSMTPHTQLYGLTVMTAGWGVSNLGETPTILEKAALTILSKSDCEERVRQCHGRLIPIHERHLCTAANPYVLIQIGDSGGPLLYENNILGIHKSTMPFPELAFHPDKVNIHTGLIYYRSFIDDVLQSHQQWF